MFCCRTVGGVSRNSGVEWEDLCALITDLQTAGLHKSLNLHGLGIPTISFSFWESYNPESLPRWASRGSSAADSGRVGHAQGVLVPCEMTSLPHSCCCQLHRPRGHLCSKFSGGLWKQMKLLLSFTHYGQGASLPDYAWSPPHNHPSCSAKSCCPAIRVILFVYSYVKSMYHPACPLKNPSESSLSVFWTFFSVVSNQNYLKLSFAHQLSL